MGRIRANAAILLSLGLVLGVTACSGNGEDTDSSADGGSFADQLAMLPDSLAREGSEILVVLADLDAAAEAAGVSRPGGAADADALRAYAKAIQGMGVPDGPAPEVAAPLPERVGTYGVARAEEFEAELGWSLADVSWFAEYPAPPVTLTVLGGEFTEARLAGAMGPVTDGRWRVGEGDDLSVSLEERSAARPLGQPLTLALDSGRLLVSTSADPVADALTGAATLAEVPELRALAEAMAAEQAYATMLSTRGRYQPALVAGGLPEDAGPVLQPFDGVATGLGHDGEPYLVLAYAHADAGTAQANAEALRGHLDQGHSLVTGAAWSELLTVVEIRADGTTVVARLGLAEAHPALAWQILHQRESLLWHE